MGLQSWLWRQYWRCERLITPGLRYSQAVYEEFLRETVKEESRWLDIGCGNKVLPTWRAEAEREIIGSCACFVGLDPDLRSLCLHRSISGRVSGDATNLPFSDNSFSLVTANMVVEHLDDPPAVFCEVARILHAGGTFLFHTSNLRGYSTQLGRLVPSRVTPWLARLIEHRSVDEVYPTRFRANTKGEIAKAARSAGLVLGQFRYLVTSAQFATILPAAVLELLWLKMLMSPRLEAFRPNLIVALRKPFR